ncbi:TetR/AcrR family transcriptional regulator [Enterococcus sp. HY326]|uniref:TetR/AcrR family transcriptional regulator n=1 Tax=Enterococcus sp. HY326 TaxID=2971265 RepID=UPI00223ED51F|nr:TetR/AcrR family transcriptional regulator [Enterococcus sp. HY326]
MTDKSTSKLITDCFVDLLLKKNFKSISITEITKEVNISRVTFYKNFRNKEDILDTLIEKLLREFDSLQQKQTAILKKTHATNSEELKRVLLPNTLELLCFFCEHKQYIRALLANKSLVDFMDLLHLTYYNQFSQALLTIFSKKIAEDVLNYYATFIAAGVNAVIEQWFYTGLHNSPETIVEILLNMLIPPLTELHLLTLS